MARPFAVLLALCALLLAGAAPAQTGDSEGPGRIGAAEEQRLRAILAEPWPAGASQQTYRDLVQRKDAAAVRLDDVAARIALLREGMEKLPDSFLRNNLARALSSRNEHEEAYRLMQQAIATAESAGRRSYYTALVSADLAGQWRHAEVRDWIAKTRAEIDRADSMFADNHGRVMRVRARSLLLRVESLLEGRFGHFAASVRLAREAEADARRALGMTEAPGAAGERPFVLIDLHAAMSRRLSASRDAAQFGDAEIALADLAQATRELRLPAWVQAALDQNAGSLRHAQGEFAQAELLLRRSDQGRAKLGYEPLHPVRVELARELILTLWGQKRYADARAELDRLDAAAAGSERMARRTRLRWERGLALLGSGDLARAAAVFEEHAAGEARNFGPDHFNAGRPLGLQGVALLRMGGDENRRRALPLLRRSVEIYMLPANADYVDNLFTRKLVREQIFGAYLDAVSHEDPVEAAGALGVADWLRGSAVQGALADAAARAAAGNPAIADVVRQEQDAKNELRALRDFLGAEAEARSIAADAVAALRARVTALEQARAALQSRLKNQLPEYEQLLRPRPADGAQLRRSLAAHEALVSILPAGDAVYVWAVTADGAPRFHRAGLTEAQMDALVQRLRRTLDFGTFAGRVPAFDAAAAAQLYDALLRPVAPLLAGKPHWIVAAAGRLGELPLSVLLAQPPAPGTAPAWLVRQAAVTQVPSVSAWLSVTRLASARRAPEALLAWGDPEFSAARAAASPGARAIALSRAAPGADVARDRAALRYSDIPPLPDTREELMAIAGALGADIARDLVLGSGATRDSVLAANRSGLLARKRVLVFATHGLVAGDLPGLGQPALALAAVGAADANPLAPLLTLDDVMTLKVNADWVVLSACNTAAADGQAREALSGLARGFFYAGGRSLLVTHWAVETVSARLLTTYTFEHYVTHADAPKAESLRQAMLKLMADPRYAHPAYWAPYALVGDGGR